jgi:hypothetical protein
MPIRPEADRKLRAGFQRRVDQQAARHAAELAHAEELAARFGCGAVAGVFSAEAGGGVRRSAYVTGLLPLALIPVLIAAIAIGVPGLIPVLAGFPFAMGAWFGLSMWRGRERKRRIWFYAFTLGCMLLDGPRPDAAPLRWNEVTEVSQVWTQVYNISAEEYRPAMTGYRLQWADGQVREISRSCLNVRDPYAKVGPLLRGLLPQAAGQALPSFPTIDEIIATYPAPSQQLRAAVPRGQDGGPALTGPD